MSIAGKCVRLTAVVGYALCMGAITASGAYGLCPNEEIRTVQGVAQALPNCRAYEQVSPADKGYLDALGAPYQVQSSPSGTGVTFYSVSPFPIAPGGDGVVTYLSSSESAGWATRGVLPPGPIAEVLGLSEDLSTSMVLAVPGVLAPEAVTGQYNYYAATNATSTYRLLARSTEEARVSFDDATSQGSAILFEDAAEQAFGPLGESLGFNEARAHQLYLSRGGHTFRVGVLPGEQPSDPPPPEGEGAGTGNGREAYNQHTLSNDGTRVVFTDSATGTIYMREVPLSGAATTAQISAGKAIYRGATPDGQHVFYTESEQLYRADLGTSLTRTPITEAGAEVQGVLGISHDGAYGYFVAKGALATNVNSNGQEAVAGETNLYEWHEGGASPVFIARLSAGSDAEDWSTECFCTAANGTPADGEKTSRVTPSGTTVLFTSVEPLTKYDNGKNAEIYRFDAETEQLVCVSCNPRTTVAHELAHLGTEQGALSLNTRNAFVGHNLSEDGSRVFFQTGEAELPGDTNGASDVYEWEREGDSGAQCQESSASFIAASDGCLYLISSGRSPTASYFGDASASGNDVFFFTRQQLVAQDKDGNMDAYDARVGGGILAQNPGPPPPPCAPEACHGLPVSSPTFGLPSSAGLSGVGNLQPPPPAPPGHHLTRAQQLRKALKSCRAIRRKHRRSRCEARARRRYGPVARSNQPRSK